MKILMIIGIVLLILAAALAVLVLSAPQQIAVSSAVLIQASPEAVFDQVRYFSHYPGWSPWKESDPEQQTSVEGPDGLPGARYSWVGVREPGKGYQELTAIEPGRRIDIQCHIQEPFKSDPKFVFHFEPETGGVRVTQEFRSDMPVPMNAIGLLMGLKANIQRVSDRGLARLKARCEQQTHTAQLR